jgi:hypothetical protein
MTRHILPNTGNKKYFFPVPLCCYIFNITSKMKTLIADWLGKTKTSARRVMSDYIKKSPLDVRFTDDKLRTLLQHHPTKRFHSASVFAVMERPPYHTRALYVESRTGSWIECSYIKCIDMFYGGYDKEKNHRSKVLSALRNEAFHSAKMQEARAALGNVCAKCGKTCRKLVIDHDGKPFAQIVDEFAAEMQIELADIKPVYRNRAYTLRRTLGRGWREFHDRHATLVGLCAKCNGSLGARGYRHKK